VGGGAAFIDVATPRGTARVDLDHPADPPLSLLVLGHGAGGGVDAPDLCALRDAARAVGVCVARVTQPYRVAGRRAPAPAGHLDEAWLAVLAALRAGERRGAAGIPLLAGLPLVVGGRSSGARVACRTARAAGAAGVVALAFPLHPPGRPDTSRAAELATGLPTLVVNGDRDPFGVPDPDVTSAPTELEVRVIPGARHDLRRDPGGAARLVIGWLARHGWCEPGTAAVTK
jgi:predicted alpha/beta-hydrolase family hydrolase